MNADWSGRVQVYTGRGKGKTTAALGLALRAAGWGLPVYIGQFLKQHNGGEHRALNRNELPVTLECFGTGRFVTGAPDRRELEAAAEGVRRCTDVLRRAQHRLVVLDEILGAIEAGVVEEDTVTRWIDERPASVELVLTGRTAPQSILERADLVSEVTCTRHYFDAGVPARCGIEW
ncbi:Cob(I)yrinic acid a,c-diamide adenosyltransferase [Kiritimatiella glycovorans]|uniref:corrinoid adenosyltransferase n=2 Tax=Kiritimatiella glycovorans TaxID=1307763 RepID=A0A0G3EDH6_9BACT|nr:Cob(I)yrinic acid a,c-diamide adenosyltransferase [Kiritimatiella glycovorans]